MTGASEIWSKAIAFVIAEEALKQKRKIQFNLFDSHIQNSVTIEPNKSSSAELLDFVGDWFLRGGTNFNSVLDHALKNEELTKQSDVLMITDGESSVNDTFAKRHSSVQRRHRYTVDNVLHSSHPSDLRCKVQRRKLPCRYVR